MSHDMCFVYFSTLLYFKPLFHNTLYSIALVILPPMDGLLYRPARAVKDMKWTQRNAELSKRNAKRPHRDAQRCRTTTNWPKTRNTNYQKSPQSDRELPTETQNYHKEMQNTQDDYSLEVLQETWGPLPVCVHAPLWCEYILSLCVISLFTSSSSASQRSLSVWFWAIRKGCRPSRTTSSTSTTTHLVSQTLCKNKERKKHCPNLVCGIEVLICVLIMEEEMLR